MLQKAGLRAGECPEKLNLTAPEAVERIQAILTAAQCQVDSWTDFLSQFE